MLREMSWEQLQYWIAYSEIDPFGEARADLRSGIVAAVVANANRDPNRGSAYQPKDFMPEFNPARSRGERTPLTSQEAWEQVKRMAKAFAGAAEG